MRGGIFNHRLLFKNNRLLIVFPIVFWKFLWERGQSCDGGEKFVIGDPLSSPRENRGKPI